MSGRRQRVNPIAAGVAAGLAMLLVVGVMGWINLNFSAPWPFSSTHTLVVETTDADGISVSSDVRIQGRLVGQVTAVQATGQNADVTVHVDNSEWPLSAKTAASVRLATLLGQKYIELEPPVDAGNGPWLQDNAVLKGARPVVDFDQILSTFDPQTREALRDILATGGRAVANQEGTLQNLVHDASTLNQASQVSTGELATRDPELNSILSDLAVTADQLSQSRSDLVGVIDNANRVTGALAQNTGALRGFVRDTDSNFQVTDTVLGSGFAPRLAQDLIHLDPVVHDLRNLLGDLLPQSRALAACCIPAGSDLVITIDDATSQSDRDGNWLRQNLQTLDLSNILPGVSPTGSSTGAVPPPSHGSAATSPLPALPPLPGAPGPVCVLNVCVGGSSGSSGSTGSGSGGSGTCVLGVLGTCTKSTSDVLPAAPAATESSTAEAGTDYTTALFSMWEAG